MKKLLFIIMIVSTSIGYAQEQENSFLEHGRWGLGGAFSLSSNYVQSEYDNNSHSRQSFNFVAVPKLNYSIGDNWVLGLSFRYDYSSQESATTNQTIYHAVGFAPNIQKYFPIYNKFAFSLQGSLDYSRRWSVNSLSTTNSFIERWYSVSIRPGFSYFLNKHFALEATTGNLSYSIHRDDRNDVEVVKAQNLRFNFGLSNIQFGAIYYF